MGKHKPIEIKINKNIRVEPEGIFKAKVIPSGNGAVISFLKRFIGKDVVVIVAEKITNQSVNQIEVVTNANIERNGDRIVSGDV